MDLTIIHAKQGADAAGAALGGRTPRRSPGTSALCNQGNDGNCCCSQPLAAEKGGERVELRRIGVPVAVAVARGRQIPFLIVRATWCLGTIPRSSKGSASWREKDAGTEKKRHGMGRKTGARQGDARGSGRGWRVEKKIERRRGEACARVSIGAADSKRASHAKNGQRRLRDGKR